MRRLFAVSALLLAGCASAPHPDPPGPTVLREAQVVQVPVAIERHPPPELLQPLGLEAPDITAGQGDYCTSRAGMEMIIDAMRAAAERLAQWKAWAQ